MTTFLAKQQISNSNYRAKDRARSYDASAAAFSDIRCKCFR